MSIAGLKYFLTKPGGWFFFLSSRGLLNWMDDETYLRREFKYSVGHELDLDNPKTFNEKLQWLKLHDRRPLYTSLVDKFEVKRYVAEKIGPEYVIPVVGGPWDTADEIDFDALPKQFVLKCTHDSGGLAICRDKASFDREGAKKKLAKAMRRNYFWSSREWPYKDVRPRVLAEEYIEDGSGELTLTDYKVMCFGGEPRLIQVHKGRTSSHTQDFYDTDWNALSITQELPSSGQTTPRPAQLEEMLQLSQTLAAGLPQVRVDWYLADRRLFFGELTFFDGGGFAEFEPDSYNYLVGEWIRLPSEEANA